MEVKRLDWDSGFFGLEVFGVELDTAAGLQDISGISEDLKRAGADLAYIFLESEDIHIHDRILKSGASLYDEKITYSKALQPGIPMPSEGIGVYSGEASGEILELVLLAGHESRFRKDPRLCPYFERLYGLWLSNSLSGSIADKVFVYSDGKRLAGMVTCKLRDGGIGNIGLIATATGFQGKGIGGHLIQAADAYHAGNGAAIATVVTQKSNIQACRFYEKSGFTRHKLEFVYHLWLK